MSRLTLVKISSEIRRHYAFLTHTKHLTANKKSTLRNFVDKSTAITSPKT